MLAQSSVGRARECGEAQRRTRKPWRQNTTQTAPCCAGVLLRASCSPSALSLLKTCIKMGKGKRKTAAAKAAAAEKTGEQGAVPAQGGNQHEWAQPTDPPRAVLAVHPAGAALALAVGPELRVFDARWGSMPHQGGVGGRWRRARTMHGSGGAAAATLLSSPPLPLCSPQDRRAPRAHLQGRRAGAGAAGPGARGSRLCALCAWRCVRRPGALPAGGQRRQGRWAAPVGRHHLEAAAEHVRGAG